MQKYIDNTISIEEKTAVHPCYNHGAHKYARMHIPVAPKCNVSCNYCSRKYDCANESRPGVTSEVLTPEQALEKFKLVKNKMSNLTVVGIAGPGDALANFDETKRAIELIREESPETIFCLSTNGLMLPFYANEIINLGVSHVTITINTIDPKIGAKIYKKVNYLGNELVGEEAAKILLNNQLSGLKYLATKGVICKVNIVMVKNINDNHIPEVVKKVKEYGAFITNIMQMIPVEGSVFQDLPLVSNVELNNMRRKCEIDLKQMYHCKQCRADAIGTLSQDCSIDFRIKDYGNKACDSSRCNNFKDSYRNKYKVIGMNKNEIQEKNIKIDRSVNIISKNKKYRFAVCTKTGINIDLHFGHVNEFYIYDYINGEIKFVEKRNINKYCTGIENCDSHEDKISKVINRIHDCNVVLAVRVGFEPTQILNNKGIKIFQMYERISEGIEKVVRLLEENLNRNYI